MEYLSDAYKRMIEHRLALLNDMSSGVSVYAVYADYHPSLTTDRPYYVMARSRKEAKVRFNRKFSWLKVFKCEPLDYHKAVQAVLDVEHNIVI